MADEPQKTVVRANAQDAPGTLGVAGINSSTPTTVIQMSIWALVGVRVVRVYLQSIFGLLTADGMGFVELAKDQNFWIHVEQAAFISLAVAFMSLLQNLLEFLTRLDVDRPGLRA
jgi:hypothetical protein